MASQEQDTGVQGTAVESLPGYLPWEDDLEMVSKYLDRKEALQDSHQQYMQEHPALKAILADFMQALLIQKPDNVYQFARDFFAPFSPNALSTSSYPSHTVNSKS